MGSLSCFVRKPLALAVSSSLAMGLAGSAAATFPGHVDLTELDGQIGFVIDGEVSGDKAGHALAAVGDVNGDGIDDFVIGAPYHYGSTYRSGRSYVVFGTADGFPPVLKLSELDGSDGFVLAGDSLGLQGWSASAAGDLNGDGFDDLSVGAIVASPNGASSGRTYVIFGRPTHDPFPTVLNVDAMDQQTGFRINGATANERSGWSVSAAGDVNGDGRDDLILGAIEAAPNGTSSGRAYVVFGRAAGDHFPPDFELSALDGEEGFKVNGETNGHWAGYSVAGPADLNSDGIDDIVVVARNASEDGGTKSGRTYVVFGRSDTDPFPAEVELNSLDGTNGFFVESGSGPSYIGPAVWSAATPGDLNGDGVDDLVVGVPREGINTTWSGRGYVVFGRESAQPFSVSIDPAELDGSNGFRIIGEMADTWTGFSVRAAGDVNGDGRPDLVIGGPRAKFNGTLSGRSYVVFGRGGNDPFPADLNLADLNGVHGFKLTASVVEYSGRAVAGGDFNGDGIDDILIGAPYSNPSGFLSGRVYVVFGRAPGLVVNPDSIDFGEVHLGSSSLTRSVVIGNTDTTTLTVQSVQPPGSGFMAAGGSCAVPPFALSQGESCTLDYAFVPQVLGPVAIELTVTTDGSPSARTFSLAGVAAPPAAQIGLNPERVIVDIQVGTNTEETISVSNSGDATLEWQVVDAAAIHGQVLRPINASTPVNRADEGTPGTLNELFVNQTTPQVVEAPPQDPAGQGDAVMLSHSDSMDIVAPNSVACGTTTATIQNRYLRVLPLQDFGLTSSLDITAVTFGIELATTTFDLGLNLYTLDGPLTFQNLTPIGSRTIPVTSGGARLLTIPIAATVPAGETLVIELSAPDLLGIGAFLPGSNPHGESSPSYIACGPGQPFPFSVLGAPHVNLVMSVTGTSQVCTLPDWLDISSSSGEVSPGQTEMFDLAFNTSQTQAGHHTNGLCVASNDPDRSLSIVPIQLTIDGPALTADPDVLDFGAVVSGTASDRLNLALRSTGTQTLAVDAIAEVTAPFHLVSTDCPAVPFTLEPLESCNLEYEFAPILAAPVARQIDIQTNAGLSSITLQGQGVAGAPASLTLLGGGSQSATVGTGFPLPLTVQIRDAWNNPVPAVEVHYTVPDSGASAVLSAPSAQSDVNGYVGVTAAANDISGSYLVIAEVPGVEEASFPLTNVDAAFDVDAGISVDREYVRPGQMLDYVITLGNAGPDMVQSADLASTLAPELDINAAAWQCIGPSTSGCAPGGQGELVDGGLSVVPGGQVSYLLSAPVRIDAEEAAVTSGIEGHAVGDVHPGNDTASAHSQMILYRDGFEAYGGQVIDAPVDQLARDETIAFVWSEVHGSAVDTVVLAMSCIDDCANEAGMISDSDGFRVERLSWGQSDWIRLLSVSSMSGEKASSWIPVRNGDILVLHSHVVENDGDELHATVVLSSERGEVRMPVEGWGSYQLQVTPPSRRLSVEQHQD